MNKHDALAEAIETGDAVGVKQMLAAHPELANGPNWTPPPLHCAVLWNQPRIAEILLDNGADLEGKDPDRAATPLEYAIVYGKKDLIPLFLSRGARTEAEEGGRTALQLAMDAAAGAFEQYEDLPARSAYGEIVELLRSHGLKE